MTEDSLFLNDADYLNNAILFIQQIVEQKQNDVKNF